MYSNAAKFPAEQFMSSIQNNKLDTKLYLSQVKKLNIEWIYQIIKNCHIILSSKKQKPSTRLSALQLIKDLLETCQVPCINLIQIYILPIIYGFSIYRTQSQVGKRGSNYFIQFGKNPNIQSTGIKFIQLSSEIVYAGSKVKPFKTFQNQQLKKSSQFFTHFQGFKNYGIQGTNSVIELKSFSQQFKQKGRQIYIQNLSRFNKQKNGYGEYFVNKVMDSVLSDVNPLFNYANQSTMSDLDIRKLLKQGDVLITSPLIEELITQLKSSQNFLIKKNCLSLLVQFFKWGDAQAISKICSENVFQSMVSNIAQIQGHKGISQGENIFKNIKGQRQGKKKFYIQYIKSIQAISYCIQNSNIDIQQAGKLTQLYKFFKKQKKFVFPQNLKLQQIVKDFNKRMDQNLQRNYMIMKKRQSTLSKGKKSRFGNAQRLNVVQTLRQQEELCIQNLHKLCKQQNELNEKMQRLQKFARQFDNKIDNLEQSVIQNNQQQLQVILENAQQLIKAIQKIQPSYQQYKENKISYQQFKRKYEVIIKQYQFEESARNSRLSQTMRRSKNSNISKQHIEQLNNSSNKFQSAQKSIKNYSALPELKKVEQQYYQTGDIHNMQPLQKRKLGAISMSQNRKSNFYLQRIPNSQKNSEIRSQKNDSQNIANQIYNEYNQMKSNNQHSITQKQEQILNKITSSILSNKQKQKTNRDLVLLKNQNINSIQNNNENYLKPSINSKMQSVRSSLIDRIREKNRKKQQVLQKISVNQSHKSSVNNPQPQIGNKYVEWGKDMNQKKVDNLQYLDLPSFKASHNKQQNQIFYKTTQQFNNHVTPVQVFSSTQNNFDKIKQSNSIMKQKSKKSAGLLQVFSKKDPSGVNNQQIGKQNFQKVEDLNNYNQGQLEFNSLAAYKNKSSPNDDYNQNNIIQRRLQSKKANDFNPQSFFKRQMQQNHYKGQLEQYHLYANKHKQDNRSYNKYKDNKIVYVGSDYYGMESQRRITQGHLHYNINEFQSQYSRSSVKSNQVRASKSYSQNFEGKDNNFNQKSIQNPIVRRETYYIKPNYQIKDGYFNNIGNNLRHSKSSNSKSSVSILNYQAKMNSSRLLHHEDQDLIREPDNHPLLNSFYNSQQIGKKLEKSIAPQFKLIFEPRKQYLMTPNKSRPLSNNYFFSQDVRNKFTGDQVNYKSLRPPHEEYLMGKIRRQYEKEVNKDQKQLQTAILNLRKENSILRNQFSKRQSRNNQNFSDRPESFSISRSSNNSPLQKGGPKRLNGENEQASSIIRAPGIQISDSTFNNYLQDIHQNKTKKLCLLNKSILLNNQLCEIGFIFNQAQQSTQMTLYITPFKGFKNFSYTISKQPNLQLQSYCRGYDQIPANKQIKIQIIAKIKNLPYSLPIMNIKCTHENENKIISFYLPFTFNRFIRYLKKQPIAYQKIFKSEAKRIMRTSQFKVNQRTFKRNQLVKYFSNFTPLSDLEYSKYQKFGLNCKFKNNQICLVFIMKGKQKMVIQGSTYDQQLPLQYLMATFKKIIEHEKQYFN